MQKAHQCIETMLGTHRLVSFPNTIALESEAENQSTHKHGCQMTTAFSSKIHELYMGQFPKMLADLSDLSVSSFEECVNIEKF